MSGPPGYAVTQRVQPRRPSGKRPILPIAAAVVAGLALTVLLVARSTTTARRSDPHPDPQAPRGAQPGEPRDRPAAPPVEDRWGASTPLDGTKIDVGQGVQLIIPSTFVTSTQSGLTVAHDSTGVLIMAGLIDIASNDPMELARSHARRNHMIFDTMKTVVVGGVERPMATFHVVLNGVVFRHIAVALIGPSYRVAVMFQAPLHRFTSDRALDGQVFELYTRRVVLP
jgi:hypothetical protein